MFVSIVRADTCILQKQVLFAKLGYEKRYAFSKYFSSINEAFKKLYGFPKEGEPLVKPSTKWGMLQSITPLMTDELKKEYSDICDKTKAEFLSQVDFKNLLDNALEINNSVEQIGKLMETNMFRIKVHKYR